MAIPKNLSVNPYDILNPEDRWRPGAEELNNMPIGHLLPPLVDKVRRAVKQWRDDDYPHISHTSRALLRWWFCRNIEETSDAMHYYFAQREAVESVIYLYEHQQAKARDKFDLLRYSSGGVTPDNMEEDWRRFVIKMATGSGKTKVMSLLILWSYFHKSYEEDSDLSRNILLIAPNIIVLDRLYRDFAGLRIFYEDGAIPEDGYEGRDWQNNFNMRLHKQDDVRGAQTPGNLYLTNIHRVYTGGDDAPSAVDEDSRNYFLGKRAADIKKSSVDLSVIVRDTNELLIINDEAHHIHDSRMAWFQSIKDIHSHLAQKEAKLSLQVDLTATPKHDNGAIFPQTISDYPLVEAIHQGIVKRPVIPNDESESQLKVHLHTRYSERFADYIKLGVIEWRKAREEHKKANKKAVLFIMTDDTRNCNELAKYLQKEYTDLNEKVLVIHTNKDGEIGERVTGRKAKELQQLRKDAAEIDNADNKFLAVVSVLMLREGWDVRNVTTIVGLRAYVAASKILPEQTLGRGLRLMYGDNNSGEKVSVIGTAAFSDFVKEIEKEGVKLEREQMGINTMGNIPRIVTIDRQNEQKDIEELDIVLPLLSRRFSNELNKVYELRAADIKVDPAEYKIFGQVESREIIFCDVLTGKESHRTILGSGAMHDYSHAIAYFTRRVMKEFGFFSRYDFFYELIETFIRDYLFGKTVTLEAEDTLRNLADAPTTKKIIDSVGTAIGRMIRAETSAVSIQREIKINNMRSFSTDNKKPFYQPTKSAQNYIIADNSQLEIDFAKFLNSCPDIIAFAKNYFAVGFAIEYVKTNGTLSRYFPDFAVKDCNNKVWIIETKGREDDNDKLKRKRLVQWRDDVCACLGESSVGGVWVDEDGFRNNRAKDFADIIKMFPL